MKRVIVLLACVTMLLLPLGAMAAAGEKETDPETGLIIAPGYELVKKNCTVCHSAMLITQNRADREGWLEIIRWMQDTQGLRQLEPETEDSILDYLAANYPPTESSRRAPLDVKFPE